MRYWLMKSEPSDVSIDDLASFPDQAVDWYGVRNYQARNFMRDQMQVGDGVLFYHSNCAEPGIAGLAEVSKPAYPDRTQFDRDSKYFDPKATWTSGWCARHACYRCRRCDRIRNSSTCVCCNAATGCPSRRSIRASGSSFFRCFRARLPQQPPYPRNSR